MIRELPETRFVPALVISLLSLAFSVVIATTSPAAAAPSDDASQSSQTPTYSDVADLVTRSDIAAKVRVDKVSKVTLPSPQGDKESQKYLLVRAKVETLIRGNDGIPPEVQYLVREADAHPGGRRLKRKQQLMIFGLRSDKPGLLQLASRRAQWPWTPELDQQVRAIAGEMAAADAPAAIVGVGDAFHSPGTIAGEGETQIFLKTSNGEPVSLSVIRRPGQQPRWGVSLGEIVDETATAPSHGSLLWYRLACALPQALPPDSLRSLREADVAAARRDYQLIMDSLGSCDRTV